MGVVIGPEGGTRVLERNSNDEGEAKWGAPLLASGVILLNYCLQFVRAPRGRLLDPIAIVGRPM